MKLSTQPYKGARDFYPEDKRIQKYIFSIWRSVVERYGYEEYDAPVLEPIELFQAKTGEEIVNQQTYTFEDRGGRQVTIRPEMTPTVSRLVAGRRQELAYPLRWYSIPNLWRYERPQRGRLREHWQLNVDLFGVKTIDGELETIMIADEIMRSFGAERDMYSIKINSRQLVNLIMAEYLELDIEPANQLMKLFDRKDKMPADSFMQAAEEIFNAGNQKEGTDKLARLLKANSMADLPSSLLDAQPVKEIQVLFTLLKDNGITNAVFDVFLMRGFDYYTDIVFEVFDTHPDNNRSLFGGGRYDGLVSQFGVEPLPTIGFGMGDVTALDFLQTHKLLPEPATETDIYVVVIGDLLRESQGIAAILRRQGARVAVDISGNKPDKQLKGAVKKQIPFALFVGETELSNETFTLKDLRTQKEEQLSLEEVAQRVKNR